LPKPGEIYLIQELGSISYSGVIPIPIASKTNDGVPASPYE